MPVPSTPVAIVGIAAQLPSGRWADTNLDYDAFFDFLLDKGEAYEPIPSSRFNIQSIQGRAVGQVLANAGAFLKDVDLFDHMEFGITAKDARLMPLSLRKLIETTFLSLCDSGIDYRGKNVGCYMSGVAYDTFSVSGHDDTEASGSFAYVPSMIANRVSYHLDLRGPTVPVDTACSSSLYATHMAVQALRHGECDVAVVGGCQLNQRFAEWLSYTQGGILSPDGKCKPFDISANGFGRGEGVVVITLKPLDAALRDRDHIYATILGTGVNSSGALVPANAPSSVAQRDAMQRAFSMAGRLPREVDFLELHATGTAQGDPTEANWVGAEFKRDDELVIGSVKGNIGHLEITAFLASLLKVCGTLERKMIPPNVNYKTSNPAIRWKQYQLRVPMSPEPLKSRSSSGRPLVAMTSSGIGGANGHAVVEGPPTPSSPAPYWSEDAIPEVPVLLVAGGLSPRSAAAVVESIASAAESTSFDATALARAYGRRARSMTWRACALAGGVGAKQVSAANFTKPALVPKTRPPIVFVFSGQGTQHFQMGRQLFAACLPFRQSILALDHHYEAVVGTSLIASTGLFTTGDADAKDTLGDPWPIAITLPALTMLQLALVDALEAVGVTPDVVVGHSAGETAVLSASGAGSKELALELAIARGRALSLLEASKGTMAAVSCSPKDAKAIIEEVCAELGDGVLTIGCFNTPSAVTLSGSETHIDAAVAKATARGVFARKLRTRVPVHSAMMELCRTEFDSLVSAAFARHADSLRSPTVETYSATTGAAFSRAFDPAYYWDGTIGPVRFDEALSALVAKHRTATFVEIGPHPVLSSYLLDRGTSPTATCPLRRPRAPEPGVEVREFVGALGKIVGAGHNCVDFDVLYAHLAPRRAKGPAYPFAPKRLPWFVQSPEIARQRQHRDGPMNFPQLAINVRTHPGLADHIIKGEPIMPAAGFIEQALEFGASAVYDVTFHGLLALSADRPTPVQVKLEGTKWSVSSASSTDYTTTWPIQYNRLHATGFLSLDPIPDTPYAHLDLNAIRGGMKPMDMKKFYSDITSFANYGPMYRRIKKCYLAVRPGGAVDALAELKGNAPDIPNCADYRLHPAILDAAIHTPIHPAFTGNYDPNLYHLPSRVRAFRLCPGYFDRPFPDTIFSHARFESWTPESLVYNFTITDPQGVPLCVVEGLEIALHGFRMKPLQQRCDVVYRPIDVSLESIVRSSNGDISGHPNGYANGHTNGYANGDADKEVKTGNLVLPYVRGAEVQMFREHLAHHDPLQPLSVFFVAETGIDGDAAQGFTRSLRKEFPAWTVRVAAFPPSWTPGQRMKGVSHLQSVTSEVEMRVDEEGKVLVPRIDITDGPSDVTSLDTKKPWKVENGRVAQLPLLHTPSSDHTIVRVSQVGPRCGECYAFMGVADHTSNVVVGLASGPFASHLVVHKGVLAEVSPDFPILERTPPIFALALVALTVGSNAFSQPRRLAGSRIVVVEQDQQLRAQIAEICSSLGLDVLAATALSREDLESCYDKKARYVISGTSDATTAATLRGILSPRGSLCLWNNPDSDKNIASIIANDPWTLGDAVRSSVDHECKSSQPFSPPASLLEGLPTTAARSPDLFDPEKAYILVGGIGSLGFHMALWMYERGARHLVLTSRTGVESLERRGDYIAERILGYLRARGDLTLETVPVDGTSKDGMRHIVQSISRPLGGCVLLAALLVDGMLTTHTEESFERVFPPKIDAFKAMENAVDLNTLDFVVTFSSVSGMFGNPGQTSYAAANSALAGLTRKYTNAFSIVAPIIHDSRVLTLSDDSYNKSVRHMLKWGMTARDLCDCIGDGILKLRDAPVWQYVPGFDWRAVRDGMGPSHLYDHLVPADAPSDSQDAGAGADRDRPTALVQTVCRVLDVKEAEASVDVPLTTYGLDSLSAAALSFALRPLVAVTQVQLLADLTMKDLLAKLEAAEAA
ncbi:ketoacyl-synt-domain-containing protein [Epithele typhae]|uniref:ketoacyl-synt-domain-containing protein n=1 Tax=Epithele typhae TaxID=378194 RepID=UPI00200852A6|nr:ketoacyl-synt-domain-containing protein [Epithele typhae]KAH9933653.1 ketoacyl-synt-domain-containing protein [Epithele typhae]